VLVGVGVLVFVGVGVAVSVGWGNPLVGRTDGETCVFSIQANEINAMNKIAIPQIFILSYILSRPLPDAIYSVIYTISNA
jgi:hypothetical protein